MGPRRIAGAFMLISPGRLSDGIAARGRRVSRSEQSKPKSQIRENEERAGAAAVSWIDDGD
jgi:hypothetical protein